MDIHVRQHGNAIKSQSSFLNTPISEQALDVNNVDHLRRVHGRYEELSKKQREQMLAKEQVYKNRQDGITDPHDPILYHVFSDTLPKEYHYRIVPKEKDQVNTGMSDYKKKGFRRRYIYEGWNNCTPFEKEQIELVKQKLRDEFGIDTSKIREDQSTDDDDEQHGVQAQGVDYLFTDVNILRYLVGWQFDLEKTTGNIVTNLEWRQINAPVPLLNEKSLELLNLGMFYIHGRGIDGSPVFYYDMTHMAYALDNNVLTAQSCCNLFNFSIGYMQTNMLVPGQVEKLIAIINTNQFALTKIPVSLFKAIIKELQSNHIDVFSVCSMLNLTWIQNKTANFLLKLCDPIVRQRTITNRETAPEELNQFIYKSQREVQYGGNVPKLTKFWPPNMPPMTEVPNEHQLNLVPRENYAKFIQENKDLTPMPVSLRSDMPSPSKDRDDRTNKKDQQNPRQLRYLNRTNNSEQISMDQLYQLTSMVYQPEELEENSSLNEIRSIKISRKPLNSMLYKNTRASMPIKF